MSKKCPKCSADNPDTQKFCGDCGTLLPSLENVKMTETLETPKEELTTGTTFAGRFQIIEELGKGGMGRVYKVLDKETNEKIALKLIKPEISFDKKSIERFRNELTTARKIVQKNVCRMYDLGKEKDSYFITMEYISGQDLKGLIRQTGQLTVGKAISIAKQICEGLSEAHSLGVVHRDLKPNNIMIDRGGNAKIMDFSIARAVKEKSITGPGVAIGTPQYMSPEQVEGKDVDHRSDIYSLGIVLYEMLTARAPFEGDTPLAVGVKQKTEAPEDPKKYNNRISDGLSHVILKCLNKNKESRYQSADEVWSELGKLEQGLPTTDRITPKKKSVTSREITVRLNLKKPFFFVSALLVIFIIVMLLWSPWAKKQVAPESPGKPSLAVLYFKNNTGDESLNHWRAMLSNMLITDLTQSKHLRILSESSLYNILDELGQMEAPTFSTDVLRQVAEKGKVDHILQGSYAKAGDEFRINVILLDASTLENIDSESLAGTGEQSIFSIIDRLTPWIKSKFSLTQEQIKTDVDRAIEEVTTSSPEAYRYFYEGERWGIKGEFRKAIEFYKKAVEIDPEFATAYVALSVVHGNIGYQDDKTKYLDKAKEHMERLSDQERFGIQSRSYMLNERTYDQAMEVLNEWLDFYPDSLQANNLLGIMYNRIGDPDKAIKRYEFNAARGEEVVLFYNLSHAYMDAGLHDKAIQALERYLREIADISYIHLQLARVYREMGRYNMALAEVEEAITLDPGYNYNLPYRAEVNFYRGELTKSEEDYRKMTEKDDVGLRRWGMLGLAEVYLVQGRFEDVRSTIRTGISQAEKVGDSVGLRSWWSWASYLESQRGDLARALDYRNRIMKKALEDEDLNMQRRTLYRIGLIQIKKESLGEAEKSAARLKGMLDNAPNPKDIRFFYFLKGKIELAKGNFSQAIGLIEDAISFLNANQGDHLLYADSLGSAYLHSGDLDKAIEQFERIIGLSFGRKSWGDLYALSFFQLGKIYEQQGDTAKAVERYTQFLDLWKDADPGIAEVEDAKKRLEALKNQ